MANHKIRRLPILHEGQLAGIISLGDIVRHDGQKAAATKSLKAISTPANEESSNRTSYIIPLIGLSLAALSSTMIAWLTWTQDGQVYRKQLEKTKLYHTAQETIGTAQGKIDEIASSKTAQNLRKQVRSNMKEISAQMPTIEYKPPKRKFAWFQVIQAPCMPKVSLQ
jgi:CBS domain-containing protein